MSEVNDHAVETVEEDPHEGGFRAHIDVSTDRGGSRYGEFSEQVRLLMDNARYACPDDELVDDLIEHLTAVNERLAKVRIDEWHSPAGTRIGRSLGFIARSMTSSRRLPIQRIGW